MKKSIIIMIFAVLFCYCQKQESEPTTVLRVNLTSTYYMPIFTEIVDVQVAFTDTINPSTENWIAVTNAKGIYNLAELSNGTKKLLGIEKLENGKITKLKINFGDKNFYLQRNPTDSTKLDTVRIDYASNFNKELIVPVEIPVNNYVISNVLIDIDVYHSLFIDKNKKYYISPKIRVYDFGYVASVKGSATPGDSIEGIILSSDGDTLVTRPNSAGSYKIDGLRKGDWKIHVVPFNTTKFKDTTFQVKLDKLIETNVDEVKLTPKK